MADVINPLSNEPIVDPQTGMPTRRFFAWMSGNTVNTNTTNTIVEVAQAEIQPASDIRKSLSYNAESADVMMMQQHKARTDENVSNDIAISAKLASLQKQIDDLRLELK